jgi:hypothetical protein
VGESEAGKDAESMSEQQIIVRGVFTHGSVEERGQRRDAPLWFIESKVPGFKGFRFGPDEVAKAIKIAKQRGIEVLDQRKSLADWLALKRQGKQRIAYQWMLEHGVTVWSAQVPDDEYDAEYVLQQEVDGTWSYEFVDCMGTTASRGLTIEQAVGILEQVELMPEEGGLVRATANTNTTQKKTEES